MPTTRAATGAPPRKAPPRTPPRRGVSPVKNSVTKLNDGSNFKLQAGGIVVKANQLKAVKSEMNDIAIALLTSSDTLRYLNQKLQPGSGAEAQALNYVKSQNAKILDDADREDTRHAQMPEMRNVQAEIRKARQDRILVDEQKRVHERQHMVYGTSSPPPASAVSLHHAASTLNPYNVDVQRKAMQSLFGIPSSSDAATPAPRPQQAPQIPQSRPQPQGAPTMVHQRPPQQLVPPPQQAAPAAAPPYTYQPYPAQPGAYAPPPQLQQQQQQYQRPPYQQGYPQQAPPPQAQPPYGYGPYAAQAAPQQAMRPQPQAPYPGAQANPRPAFTSQQFYAL